MKRITLVITLTCLLASGSNAADWKNLSNFASITAMVQNGSSLWVAGRGGIVVIDAATQQKIFYKKTAGQLPSLMVEDMAHFAATATTWIGTYDNGLVSIHGGQFTQYAFADSSIRLYHIAIDPAGTVWCATSGGLYKFNNGTYTPVAVVNALGNTWDIKAFPNGRLLIGSSTPIVYDPATDSAFAPHTSVFAYSNSHVEVKDDTSYYFASDHGGILYVHDTTVVDISDTTVAANFSPEVKQLKYLADGSLLVLKDDSKIFQYSGTTWSPYTYTADAENIQAAYLFQKNSGEVLAGGMYQGGLVRGLGTATSISIQKFGIWSDIIASVSARTDHELWITGGTQVGVYDINTASFERIDTLPGVQWSTRGGVLSWRGHYIAFADNGLYQWSGSAWVPLTISGLPTLNIMCATADTSGNLYIGTFDGVYVTSGSGVTVHNAANTPVLFNNDLVRAIHFDALRNTVWMATSLGIVRYTSGTFTIINSGNTPQISYYNYISAITQDSTGDVWFGAAYGGLIRYDGTTYYVDVLPTSLGNQTVNGITFDNGAMYVVDNVSGLCVKENGTWTNYNTKNCDMTADYVTSAFADRNHNVWLTSLSYGSSDAFGIDIYNKTSVALSIKSINDNTSLTVYPNPTSSLLTITDPALHDGDEATLTDILGKSYRYTITAHRIDISSLATGLYILHIGTGTPAVKVIKE